MRIYSTVDTINGSTVSRGCIGQLRDRGLFSYLHIYSTFPRERIGDSCTLVLYATP